MVGILFIADTHGSLKNATVKWEMLSNAQGVDAIVCLGDIYLNELQKIKEIADERKIPVYGIHGNHEPMSFLEKTGITNIHASGCKVGDVRIAGNLPEADILVSHSPYKMKSSNVIHSGLKGISWYLKNHNPKWHFYGHLHNRDQKIHQFGFLKNRICKSFCIYEAAFNTDTEELEYLF